MFLDVYKCVRVDKEIMWFTGIPMRRSFMTSFAISCFKKFWVSASIQGSRGRLSVFVWSQILFTGVSVILPHVPTLTNCLDVFCKTECVIVDKNNCLHCNKNVELLHTPSCKNNLGFICMQEELRIDCRQKATARRTWLHNKTWNSIHHKQNVEFTWCSKLHEEVRIHLHARRT